MVDGKHGSESVVASGSSEEDGARSKNLTPSQVRTKHTEGEVFKQQVPTGDMRTGRPGG